MAIRYEANPPKIVEGVDRQESIEKFVDRVKRISKFCDAVHITENVLGFERVPPIEIGAIIKKEIPELPITVSLRIRDKTEEEIIKFVEDSIENQFSGILILLGDPSQNSKPDSGNLPTKILEKLNSSNYNSKIDFYLSISNNPDFSKIQNKINSKPKGFMTQVIQNINQVENLKNNLKNFDIIPIILYPSLKNESSAKFLNLNLEEYSKNFEEFVNRVHQITGDVLITSPSDFTSLYEFLSKSKFEL